MIPKYSAYLFDIDGTLVDSARDICGAVSAVLSTTEKPDVPFDFLKGYIGRHLLDLFGDLFPGAPPERIDEMIAEYRRIYPARGHTLTSTYPGVVEALESLGGLKSTATTKGTPTTRSVLEKFNLVRFFDHVQGTDGFPCKPAPDVIYRALEGIGARADESLFIGDSAADMEAGQRAGVDTCAVTYGYGKREDLAVWSPTFWVDDLRELTNATI